MQEWMVISGTSHQGDAITTRFAGLRRRAGGLLPKLVVQFADSVDCDGDHVDRLLHRADADRRAAADQVAWQQRHVVRDIADELPGAEDHIRNWIVLTLDAVENS